MSRPQKMNVEYSGVVMPSMISPLTIWLQPIWKTWNSTRQSFPISGLILKNNHAIYHLVLACFLLLFKIHKQTKISSSMTHKKCETTKKHPKVSGWHWLNNKRYCNFPTVLDIWDVGWASRPNIHPIHCTWAPLGANKPTTKTHWPTIICIFKHYI